MIDISKIKVGDEVTVRATVGDVDPVKTNPEPIRISGGSWIKRERILTHTPAAPREFKPGDRVTWVLNDQHVWKIVALDGEAAWSKWDGYANCSAPDVRSPHFGKRETHHISTLRHADESK